MQSFDVIVLGGGAAGLMCAIEAGRRGRKVVVLERAERIGKKILISGGGRCNFTNIYCTPENFLSANPHFAKSALARYTPADFIALVEKHKISYHEKALGQLFCDRSAQEITGLLESECRDGGVEIFLNERIGEVTKTTEFVVRTGREEFRAPVLVVATGGLSIPKMGATSFGYELAKQFGLKIQPTRPALVPLVLNRQGQKQYCDLSGVSAEVIAGAGGASFREKMLITHRGLSGPAILQISSYWRQPEPIRIDLSPDADVSPHIARHDLAAAKSALRGILPQRLADRWIEHHPPRGWTVAAKTEFDRELHDWRLIPSGTEGYEKAEVRAGGIDTDELSAKT